MNAAVEPIDGGQATLPELRRVVRARDLTEMQNVGKAPEHADDTVPRSAHEPSPSAHPNSAIKTVRTASIRKSISSNSAANEPGEWPVDIKRLAKRRPVGPVE